MDQEGLHFFTPERKIAIIFISFPDLCLSVDSFCSNVLMVPKILPYVDS